MGKTLFSLFTRTPKIKLIIFDFDGTLCDSIKWFSSAINVAAKRYHFRITSEEEMQVLRGLGTREIMDHLGISWWKVPFIASFMRNHMKREHALIKPFQGAGDLLRRLKSEGFILCLVSSNSYHNVSQILGDELMENFSFVECGTSLLGKEKRFKKIIKHTGLAVQEIISVGDEVRDIEGAKSLGIRSCAVTWGYASKKALSEACPDHMVETLDELLKCLTDLRY